MNQIVKGQEIDLMQVDPGLHRVLVGLGWRVAAKPVAEGVEVSDVDDVDLDASAFLLNRENRVRHDSDFIFYNNLETEDGAIRHWGDCITGATGEEATDSERIEVNLDKMPFDVEKLSFAVTIHNAKERQQNFGLVTGAYIRILNLDTGYELTRFDLTEDACDDTGFIFGELAREGTGWKFKAMGLGAEGGLYQISKGFNVNVAAP